MSANINYNEEAKEHSFYSLKSAAWHGLGQVVQEAKTSDEVLKLAHLDWTVNKLPVYAQYPTDSNYLDENKVRLRGTIVPNVKALTRNDNGVILGSCTDRYEVLNNIDAFSFIDNIVGEKLAIYETAGALGKGEIVFVLAKLPDYIKPTDNKDIIEKYILFTTGHDGSTAVKAMFTPVRVVCNNTLNMALKNNIGRVSIKHTKNMNDKIKNAATIMNLYTDYTKKLTIELANLASVAVNDKFIDKVIANTFLTPEQLGLFNSNSILMNSEFPTKTRNQLWYSKDYIESGPGQDLSI